MVVRASCSSCLSLLVVPLPDCRLIIVDWRFWETSRQSTTGRTFIELEEVKVLVENIINEEGMRMEYIMANVNHKRLIITIGVTRSIELALSAALKRCLQTGPSEKISMDYPAVRHRLIKSGALLESQYAWIEQSVCEMAKLKKVETDLKQSDFIALAKAHACKMQNASA